MKTVDFKTSGYFPGTVIFLGVLLLFSGMILIMTSPYVGLVILLVATIIFTTHYRLKVDFENKAYHDYLWILGIKVGEKGKFDKVEYLFIKKSKVSQTMRLKAASTTIRKDIYDGYLRFSETSKIHLLTSDDKSELIDRLKSIAEKLNTKLIDYSDESAKEL